MSYLSPIRCNFWEKCTNSLKIGLGCSTPLIIYGQLFSYSFSYSYFVELSALTCTCTWTCPEPYVSRVVYIKNLKTARVATQDLQNLARIYARECLALCQAMPAETMSVHSFQAKKGVSESLRFNVLFSPQICLA